jgi:hypothetical protein
MKKMLSQPCRFRTAFIAAFALLMFVTIGSEKYIIRDGLLIRKEFYLFRRAVPLERVLAVPLRNQCELVVRAPVKVEHASRELANLLVLSLVDASCPRRSWVRSISVAYNRKTWSSMCSPAALAGATRGGSPKAARVAIKLNTIQRMIQCPLQLG